MLSLWNSWQAEVKANKNISYHGLPYIKESCEVETGVNKSNSSWKTQNLLHSSERRIFSRTKRNSTVSNAKHDIYVYVRETRRHSKTRIEEYICENPQFKIYPRMASPSNFKIRKRTMISKLQGSLKKSESNQQFQLLEAFISIQLNQYFCIIISCNIYISKLYQFIFVIFVL